MEVHGIVHMLDTGMQDMT